MVNKLKPMLKLLLSTGTQDHFVVYLIEQYRGTS